MLIEGITTFCFGASYTVALALELVQLIKPRPVLRLVGIGFGAAGLLAHSLFLFVQVPADLAQRYWSMLFLAWIVAVFYLYGAIHHRQQAWGVFVLPVVLGLIGLAGVAPPEDGVDRSWPSVLEDFRGERFWGSIHGGLLLLASVGVCVGFVASVMYLIQAHRLRAKMPPDSGLKLLSLERLEAMNRRAVNLAFPLLTIGVIVGLVLMIHRYDQLQGWADPKILGSVGLWVVVALLLYLRYGYHLRGRRLAQLTIAAFVLLLVTLVSSHSSVQGGGP